MCESSWAGHALCGVYTPHAGFVPWYDVNSYTNGYILSLIDVQLFGGAERNVHCSVKSFGSVHVARVLAVYEVWAVQEVLFFKMQGALETLLKLSKLFNWSLQRVMQYAPVDSKIGTNYLNSYIYARLSWCWQGNSPNVNCFKISRTYNRWYFPEGDQLNTWCIRRQQL